MTAQYGEPWTDIAMRRHLLTGNCWIEIDGEFVTSEQIDRIVACVNTLAGIPDNALEKVREWLTARRETTQAFQIFVKDQTDPILGRRYREARHKENCLAVELGALLSPART